MEGATVALFWGSLLAQYLWFQRENLCNHTKRIVKNAAQSVWERSIHKLREIKQKNIKALKSSQNEECIIPQEISNILNQEQEAKNLMNKQKKIKKPRAKAPKNLRKAVKRYEDWFLQSRNIRKMAKKIDNSSTDRQEASFQFKQDSSDFNDNMKNYNIQQLYEDFCEQNDDQYNNGNILGYNPIVSDEQEENESYLNNFTSRSSK